MSNKYDPETLEDQLDEQIAKVKAETEAFQQWAQTQRNLLEQNHKNQISIGFLPKSKLEEIIEIASNFDSQSKERQKYLLQLLLEYIPKAHQKKNNFKIPFE